METILILWLTLNIYRIISPSAPFIGRRATLLQRGWSGHHPAFLSIISLRLPAGTIQHHYRPLHPAFVLLGHICATHEWLWLLSFIVSWVWSTWGQERALWWKRGQASKQFQNPSKHSRFDRIEIMVYLVFEVFGIKNLTQGTISWLHRHKPASTLEVRMPWRSQLLLPRSALNSQNKYGSK